MSYKAGHWQRGLVSKEAAGRIGSLVKHIRIVDGVEVVCGTTVVDPTMVATKRKRSGDAIDGERNELTLTSKQMALKRITGDVPPKIRKRGKRKRPSRWERHLNKIARIHSG